MVDDEPASRPDRTRRSNAGAPHATITVDAAGQIVAWDAGACAVYGYAEHEVIGRPLQDLPLDRARSSPSHPTGTVRDLAEQRYLATHDPLTDLANRDLFVEQLTPLLALASEDGRTVAVVALGLDRVRTVTDSLGHHAGDHVLVTSATRLRKATPPDALVARVGDDTFVVAAPLPRGTGAQQLVESLLDVLALPVAVAGRRLTLSARAGLATSSPSVAAATLLRHADAALHRARTQRSGSMATFDSAMGDLATRRLEIEQALHLAAARDELRVHLQPIVATADGTPVGVEALVRWEHPTLGLVPPADFIPLAEDTGDIVEIGRWVLRRSCELLAAWNREGHDLHLSVNLSPRQFLEPGFVEQVAAVLDETSFPGELLMLEVTESVLVDEGPAATATLEALRALGIRLAIDDFGTGYSSLLYLRRLDVDVLKIDKSFIDGLAAGNHDDTIVRTIIDLATSLGLGVVAEGVETEEQRARLVAHGCPYAQGYLFARPLEPTALLARCRAPAPGAGSGGGHPVR